MSAQPHESTPGITAAERAYRHIKEKIISGEIPPRARLPESALASNLGISRTPVREALRRLEAEGFVEFFSNRGAQVTLYSSRDIEEVFQLRVALEGLAARLAAGRVTPAVIRRLRELASLMDASEMTRDGLDVMTEANNEFHRLVIEASGNRRLADIRAQLVIVPVVQRTFHSYSKEELDRSRLNHHELIDALENGNGQWAETVAMAHILAAEISLRQWQSQSAVRAAGHDEESLRHPGRGENDERTAR
jgi:DNA-binding GntR family transcriptional regulator